MNGDYNNDHFFSFQIGHTAVLYAAKRDYIEVAELLIVNGADTNIPETVIT